MQIAIRSTEHQKKELLEKGISKKVTVHWLASDKKLSSVNADVYFDLVFNDAAPSANELVDDKPVFTHAVNCVCTEINKPNYIRLNAWNGFINRPVTELACNSETTKKIAAEVLDKLGWNVEWVTDDYGLIAARIITMIINEAYFALEQKVSTKAQIDIAMKLGTNYPYGPFEWSEKIGLQNILFLLQKLQMHNKRYSISSLLVHESQHF